MNNRNKNSFYKSDKEKFKEDMLNDEGIMTAYGCVYVGCLFPLVFLLIVSVIAFILWQTKLWVFVGLVTLVLIMFFRYIMKLSIKGNFKKWKKNGRKF